MKHKSETLYKYTRPVLYLTRGHKAGWLFLLVMAESFVSAIVMLFTTLNRYGEFTERSNDVLFTTFLILFVSTLILYFAAKAAAKTFHLHGLTDSSKTVYYQFMSLPKDDRAEIPNIVGMLKTLEANNNGAWATYERFGNKLSAQGHLARSINYLCSVHRNNEAKLAEIAASTSKEQAMEVADLLRERAKMLESASDVLYTP